jgi:hypothetical protein
MYGKPKWEDKYKTWDKIRELHSNSNLPWALIGDFNEIIFSHEKEGGNARPQGYMQAFRDALLDCELKIWDSQVIFLHGSVDELDRDLIEQLLTGNG